MRQDLIEEMSEGFRFANEEELLAFVESMEREALYDLCHNLTATLCGDGFDTCSIINVKSGLCPEDCKWCAQSTHHQTSCESYPILSVAQVTAQAQQNEKQGIKRFSLVASGRRPSSREVELYVEHYRNLSAVSDIHLCASLGLANEEQLQRLYEAGCTTYHCNMESAPSFFPHLCSTHTQAEKEETLRAARKVGMKVCSGGIIGMGESPKQRAELALYLHSLGIQSIPINVLHPISGTPLGEQTPLDPDEVLLSFCIFRLANPTAYLRFSGGRALLSREVQEKALYIGINAAITGDLLTTKASVTPQDMLLFASAGYDLKRETTWER